MDEHTLDKLEFQRVCEMVAEHAQCSLGRQLAVRIQPSRRLTQINLWLQQFSQFKDWVTVHGLPPFGGIRDIREEVKRAVPPARLEPGEFSELSSTLTGVLQIREYLKPAESSFESLARLHERLGDFSPLIDRINRCIDERGQVRDDATERLSRLRRQIEQTKDATREVFQKLLRQPGIAKLLQYQNTTFHADRMVLPVKADQRGRVPGIVHRSSDSGQTLFVEPAEAVELNNTLINLIQAEQEEIGRILWELTHQVHLNQKEILRTLETTAVVDLLSAKAQFAKRYRMTVPQITEKPEIQLRQARNPILMAAFEKLAADGNSNGEVVPINVRLGEDFDVMMITGPNTGGKTATLKTVGLLSLMAQSGLPIPADEGSSLPVFDDIWIDVGDEQSLTQSLSTFSAHLSHLLHILRRARKSTLVLLDELGAGTDPDEGAAIGRTVVEQLLGSGCLAMVTTHLSSLKGMGFEQNRVDNACVLFDIETLRPTFELRIGEPGNSNAISIAARLGMPKKMVSTARKHLTGSHKAINRAIGGTLKARRQAERARLDAEHARQQAARQTLAALDKERELEKLRAAYETWLKRVTTLRPGEAVRVKNFDDAGRIIRVKLEKQQASVDVGGMQVDVPLSHLIFGDE